LFSGGKKKATLGDEVTLPSYYDGLWPVVIHQIEGAGGWDYTGGELVAKLGGG